MANLEIIIKTMGAENIKDLQRQSGGALEALTGLSMGALSTVGAFGALTAGLKFSVDEAIAAEESQARLDAVLRSTGGSAGWTAEMAQNLAASLSQVSVNSEETILDAESLLLTFTNVRKDVFPEAIQAAMDMSAAFGGDLNSSILQVGKALNDPNGMSAMKRIGISFSDAQMEMAKAMYEAGDMAEYQRIILAELTKETGGMAEKMATTYSGQVAILKNNLGELGETIGKVFTPPLVSAITALNNMLTTDKKLTDAYAAQEDQAFATAASWRDYAEAVLDARVRTEGMTEATKAEILAIYESGDAEKIQRMNWGLMTEQAFNFQKQYGGLVDVEDRWSMQLQANTNFEKQKILADKEAKAAAEAYAEALKISSAAIENQWGIVEKFSTSRNNQAFYEAGKELLNQALESGAIDEGTYRASIQDLGKDLGIINDRGLAAAAGLEAFATGIGKIDPTKAGELMKAIRLESADGSKADFGLILQPFLDFEPTMANLALTAGTWRDNSVGVETSMKNLTDNAKPQADKMQADLTNAGIQMEKNFFMPTIARLKEADETLKSIAARATSLKAWADANEIVIRVRIEVDGSFPSVGGSSSSSTSSRDNWSKQVNQMWSGGDFDAGDAFVAGENGPEIVCMPRAGRVFNNGESQAMLGASIGPVNFYFLDTTLDEYQLSRAFERLQDMAGGYGG